MASLRTGSRTDDTTYVQVLDRLNGRRTSFHDHASASKFRDLVNQGGPAKVPEVIEVDPQDADHDARRVAEATYTGPPSNSAGSGPAGGGTW